MTHQIQVNISEIENFVSGKTFDEIKTISEDSGIRVRELNNDVSKNLYLLIGNDNTTPLQIQSNGIILEKDTNKVVCMCQNKFNKVESYDQIENLKNNSSNFRMEYCEDGTVIRLYNYNGTWFTSTTKCIDAKYSYWSSEKTFNDMFWEVFNKSGSHIELDPEYTYLFILIHKENRIVVNHKYNNLIYINRIHNQTKVEDYTNYFYNTDPKRSIRRTKKIEVSGYINYPLDDYFNPTKRGVILKFLNSQGNWNLYQYDFNNYSKIKEVRGNVPLIRMRYLELLNDQESLQILENNYKENMMVFAMIKHSMNNLYKDIHKLYFESHIKHNITVNEDHLFYRTLKQLHSQYKQNNTPITLEIVKTHINSLDKNVLKKFLNWV
jgi:hypothetical protein